MVPEPSAAEDLAPYFSGEKLYGDDFTPEQIQQWYEDEKEACTELRAVGGLGRQYCYHALNRYYAFRHLTGRRNLRILGLGAANGDELVPISPVASRMAIVESSEAFVRRDISGVPVTYVRPRLDGVLPFPDGSIDLVTCFGVLHHIPNVTAVMREVCRCMSKGGQMLLREPVSWMGDWRGPRRGLTKRERGIPQAILRRIVLDAGLAIRREEVCMFSLTGMVFSKLGVAPYNSRAIVLLDRVLCALSRWNMTYHRVRLWRKFAPGCVSLVLEKE